MRYAPSAMLLTVTRQPTVYICLFLFVTFDTRSHAPLLGRQPMKVFNQAMAFLTGYFAIDMTLMIEQHMLGHVVNFNPGR